MKKSILAILILTFILTLSACGGNEVKEPDTSSIVANTNVGPHTHAYGEWTTVTAATCTEGGTEERVCSCGEKESKTIEATGHNEVKDAAYAATCAKEGKTAGSHCSKCNEVFVAQKTIAKLPHTEVEIPLVRATCKAEGKTKGKQCSVCKEITKAQKTVEKDEHTFGDWSVVKYATATAEGERKHTCTVCKTTETSVIDIIRNDGVTRGSADKFYDTTVIVSIFANDAETSWDFNSKEDKKLMETLHTNLVSGALWLEEQGAFYSADTKFICDWKEYPELYYTCDFSDSKMISSSAAGYNEQCKFIEDNIDSNELKQKYNAQNILYIVYFNTDENNSVRSWCIRSKKTEVINIFARCTYSEGSYIMPAATFAHEILHAFGAHDLYYASHGIPQEYVNYLVETKSNDIMGLVNLGPINKSFTSLCAYYVGLIDECADVEIWGLAKSEHLTD